MIYQFEFLLPIYGTLGGLILAGMALSLVLGCLEKAVDAWGYLALQRRLPALLGRFLFWIGVPLSIIGFLQQADLSGLVLLAPVVAWVAMLVALGCSRLWVSRLGAAWPRPTQGSFALAAMLGNTGYIGYPIVLLLPQLGPAYFGWAVFYDTLGTLWGAYGLGVVLAAQWGRRRPGDRSVHNPLGHSPPVIWELIRNPSLLAFMVGIGLRSAPLPSLVDTGLARFSWLMVMFALLLMGMRLQQITSWRSLRPASIAVAIKMIILPITIGTLLTLMGVAGPTRLVLVLQSGMPCAFATLVLTETYDLDREMTVTAVGLSSVLLLLTLPLWLWRFGG